MPMLTAAEIQRHLCAPILAEVLHQIDSTNSEAKRRIAAGLTTPLLLVADEQTAGRGRLGRAFASPPSAGLYMSLVLHPNCPAEEVLPITSAAAVAVCEAIEELTDLSPKIKWVNDVYLGDRKVAGILTEGITDPQSGRMSAVIVGIGINCTPAALPEEVAAIATSLAGEGGRVHRPRLAAAACDRLWKYYGSLATRDWLEPYRSRSYLTGKEVVWRRGEECFQGKAMGIDADGALLVNTVNGSVRLSTGEVSIRPLGQVPPFSK